VLDAGRHVALLGAAPVVVQLLDELAAAPGGAAVVHLQHRVAAREQELHPVAELPTVAVSWAAVRIHDKRRGAAAGVEQQSLDLELLVGA